MRSIVRLDAKGLLFVTTITWTTDSSSDSLVSAFRRPFISGTLYGWGAVVAGCRVIVGASSGVDIYLFDGGGSKRGKLRRDSSAWMLV